MNSFLEDVAKSLLNKYGDELAKVDVVFASRRAYIYFRDALAKLSSLKPNLYTIDRWILSFKEEQEHVKTHKAILIAKLYDIYLKDNPEAETFEGFYTFGELLLSDFDMLDRYMVDTQMLYNNFADFKELDYLLQKEDEAYNLSLEFWENFKKRRGENINSTATEETFYTLWSKLHNIYTLFQEELHSSGLSYPGRDYRAVATAFESNDLEVKRQTVFVGLNALSHSERLILTKAQEQCKADFIWDYDPSWLNSQKTTLNSEIEEPAYFIAKNLKEFPQADYFTTAIPSRSDNKIEVITSVSDYMQAKITGELLREFSEQKESAASTAVILTDEKLLMPLLHSIPPTIETLNISMGYPLTSLPEGQLITILCKLHSTARKNKQKEISFRVSELEKLLYNSITKCDELTELLSQESSSTYLPASLLLEKVASLSPLWTRVPLAQYLTNFFDSLSVEEDTERTEKDNTDSDHTSDDSHNSENVSQNDSKNEEKSDTKPQFLKEAKEVLLTTLQTAKALGDKLSDEIYLRILKSALQEKTVSFEGVSGSGLQIMGILETRSLDFDNIILLSLSDDNFPSSRPDNSYIPPVLLQGYGMPSLAEKSAIWSYYFYRLLQRSKKVSLLYCNIAEGTTTGEPSRYILQLTYNKSYNLTHRRVELPFNGEAAQKKEITKPKDESIKQRVFSPSALVKYLQCPLSFYFHYIVKLREETPEDELSLTPIELGNIVHHSLERIYAPQQEKDPQSVSHIIEEVIDEDSIIRAKKDTPQAKMGIAEATAMIHNAIDYDISYAKKYPENPVKRHLTEEEITFKIGGHKLKCIIDRVDILKDGTIRVIDYKTGKVELRASDIESIFLPQTVSEASDQEEEASKQTIYKELLQILIYCLICRNYNNIVNSSSTLRSVIGELKTKSIEEKIAPRIYALRQMTKKNQHNYSGEMQLRGDDKKYSEVDTLEQRDFIEIESYLTELLNTICDTSQPYVQCTDKHHCKYCPYKVICQR
ncbi:MAG: PD-(D/E)XK nuclease family protein [Rikenellaceae bacterium]